MQRRRIATALAALGGIGLTCLAGLAGWSVPRMDPVMAPHVTRYAVELLAHAAVVAAGLVLLVRRSELGVALLVAAAALSLPALLALLGVLAAVGAAGPFGTLVALPHLAVVAGGGVAWGVRRSERWRWVADVSWPYVGVAAALVVATSFAWVGDPLLAGSPGDGAGAVPGGGSTLATLVVGLLLLAAARLPRRLAAGALLAVVAHVLPPALLGIQHAMREGGTVTPAGWLALTSAVALGVVAVWWRDADRRAQAGRQQALADAAGLP